MAVYGVTVIFLILILTIGILGITTLMHGIVSVGALTVRGDLTVGDGASTIHFSLLLTPILETPFTLAIPIFMAEVIGMGMLITTDSTVLDVIAGTTMPVEHDLIDVLEVPVTVDKQVVADNAVQ